MTAGNPSSQVRTDPVTLQVMTNAIYSVADEMVAALVRTSFSTNIKDRRDCSGAVFTPDGQLVAQGEVGTPLHLGVMLPAVQTAIAAIPPETLEPEDDIIVNTPYPEGPGHSQRRHPGLARLRRPSPGGLRGQHVPPRGRGRLRPRQHGLRRVGAFSGGPADPPAEAGQAGAHR